MNSKFLENLNAMIKSELTIFKDLLDSVTEQPESIMKQLESANKSMKRTYANESRN